MTMMNETHSRGKIVRGTEGLGTVTPQMIEERAREIARSDGRNRPNDLDRSSARDELTGARSGSEQGPTRRNRVEIGECHLCRRAKKLRPWALKMIKTSPKN